MKKRHLLFIVTLCVALLATACTAGTSDTTPPDTQPDTAPADSPADTVSDGLSGTVSYMHWGDDYERQMYEDLFNGYMEKEPNVTVEQLFTPGDDYYTKLQTLAASQTLPDVFWVSDGRFAQFASAGLMADLTPYLEEYPAIMGDMIEGLKPYGEYDGVSYAIPKDWTSYVMYINEDIFTEMGVDIPTSDWTMDDYVDIAKQLVKKDGDRVVHYGTAVNNYRADWINFMGNFEAPWFKDGKSNISDPDAVKGLSYMYQVIEDGSALSPGAISTAGDSEDRLFIIGKVGMFPSGRWMCPQFREECDFNWTAVEMPKGTTRCTPFIAGLLCIGSSADNKDAAADLLAYQMSDEGLSYVMVNGLSMPPYNHLMTNEDYVNTPPEPDAFIATASYIGDPAQTEALKTTKWAEYQDIISAELSLAFEGDQTIEEAAANIDSKANSDVFN